MWREWVAKSTKGRDELHLVLIEWPSSTPDETGCELVVNRHHLTPHREQIASREFAGLALAQAYCLQEYGVATDAWVHAIPIASTFEFNYTLTNLGQPQPYPVASPDARIVFRCSPIENEDGQTRMGLNICGTREGLKHLAAMLILCADSDKYDPEFHIHLDEQQGVDADMDVTIRAPIYLDALQNGEFQEFKGNPIRLDDPEDSSP